MASHSRFAILVFQVILSPNDMNLTNGTYMKRAEVAPSSLTPDFAIANVPADPP